MRPIRFMARGLLSSVFISSGYQAVAHPERLVAQAKPVADRITPWLERTDPRLPTDTRTLVRANGLVQFAAGVLLATGQVRRPAAVALATTLVPTTVAGHPFWTEDDPARRQAHRVQFLKNLGLLGGLLLATVDTEGRPGLRWRTARLATDARRSAGRAACGAQHRARAARRQARLARRAARVGRLTARATQLPARAGRFAVRLPGRLST